MVKNFHSTECILQVLNQVLWQHSTFRNNIFSKFAKKCIYIVYLHLVLYTVKYTLIESSYQYWKTFQSPWSQKIEHRGRRSLSFSSGSWQAEEERTAWRADPSWDLPAADIDPQAAHSPCWFSRPDQGQPPSSAPSKQTETNFLFDQKATLM